MAAAEPSKIRRKLLTCGATRRVLSPTRIEAKVVSEQRDVFCEAAVGRLSPVGWSNNSKRGYLCKNS